MTGQRLVQPRDELARHLKVNRLMVAAALPTAVLLHAGWPSTWYYLLEALAVGYWVFLGWLRGRRSVWPDGRMVGTLCGAQWVVAVVAVSIEPWLIHIAPLFCVVPVLIAARSLDHKRHGRFALTAVLVILAATVWGRMLGNGPIHFASSVRARDSVAILVTPGFGAFIAWLAWRNQRTMWSEQDQMHESRERLAVADARAAALFNTRTADLGRRLRELIAEVDASGRSAASSMAERAQHLAADLRSATHELGAPEARLDVRADLERLVTLVSQPVEVRMHPLGSRLSVVDAVFREVALQLLKPSTKPTGSRLAIMVEEDSIVLEVENDFAEAPPEWPPLSLTSLDRLQAIGGVLEVRRRRRGTVARCVVPTARPQVFSRSSSTRDLTSDLRYGLAFPVAAFAMSLGLWLTALPYEELRDIAMVTAIIFTLPCVVAVVIARVRSQVAIAVFSASHWLTAIVVAERLNIVKYFAAIGLLIPLFLALPYVGRRVYTALTIGTCLATSIAIGLARLDRQLEAIQGASDRVTDIVVVALIPLPSAVLLVLSHRNHTSMSISANQLRRSRRELVAAAHDAQRSLERDLHDGAQQRLVSAALRLQIAARQSDEAEALRNLSLATDELREADRSLRSLRRGDPSAITDGNALLSGLAELQATNVVPVDLDLRIEPDAITSDHATALWFCCAEAVANATKHAVGLSCIRIRLSTDDKGQTSFEVADDGSGMKRVSNARSTGLLNMRERLEAHGGNLHVTSSEAGTIVTGVLPSPVLGRICDSIVA